MTDSPAPIRTEYIGIVDNAHVWQVWRTDTDEAIGWNVSPIADDEALATQTQEP